MDTYRSQAEADADRQQQAELLEALGAWPRGLRRDEYGAWVIQGSDGVVFTWGDGKTWVMHVGTRSKLAWTYAKRRLAFCQVTQDGDEEGCLRLMALPTPEQALTIRDILGLRKKVEYSPENLEALRERVAKARSLIGSH